MSRRGQTVKVRGPGGGAISSARFVNIGPVGGTAVPTGTPTAIVWDADGGDDEWNQIAGLTKSGDTITFATGGTFHIDAFAEIGEVVTPGWDAYLQIMPSNAEVVAEMQTAKAGDYNPNMAASGLHRMAGGDTLQVIVAQQSGDTKTVVNASVTIEKVG